MIIVTNKRAFALNIEELKLQSRAGQGKKIIKKDEYIVEVKED